MESNSSKYQKLKKIPHILAGSIILLHSYERYESGHSTYIFFLIAGLIFLSLAIFHHALTKRFSLVDIIFYLLEGLLSFLIAYEHFHAHKTYLPYVYIFAGLMQFFAVYKFMSKRSL